MKQSKQPLISILMPVHNTGNFLVQAIESIRSQTHKNWELLCIDDGSTDISPLLLKSFAKFDKRIRIITNKTNRGISYSLNRGLRLAKGTFIARMDADDISLPERLTEQLVFLEKNADIVACGGQAVMIDPVGRAFAYKKFPTDPNDLSRMIMTMVPLQHPILMARADVMKSYRYNETVKTAEDVDLLFYLLSKGKITNLKNIIYKYRKSDFSNGYHNVKKTFLITFTSRFTAISKYGYIPSLGGLLMTFAQFAIVALLPEKLIVKLFEAFRYQPPLWKRPLLIIIESLSSFRQTVTLTSANSSHL